MPQAVASAGVGGVTSETWYPAPPVEYRRAHAAVATLALGTGTGDNGTGGGTDGALDAKATTTDGQGTGLKVDLTIASNVCTAIVVDTSSADNNGKYYRIGDKITVATGDSGTTTPVVAYVTGLKYDFETPDTL